MSIEVVLNKAPATEISRRTATARRAVICAFAATGLLATNIFLPSLPAIAAELRVSSAAVTSTITVFLAIVAVGQLIVGPMSDRLGRRNLLLAAFVVFFLSYAGFAATSSLVVIAVLFIGYGLFQGTFRAVGKALAADLVPDHLRASGIGWYTGLVGLLQLFASVVGGLLWDRVGHQATFVYGALFAAVGAVALAALVQGDRPRNPHSPV